PDVALVPLQEPLAVQLVALVVLQSRVAMEPLDIDAGVAVNVRVGAGLPGGAPGSLPPPHAENSGKRAATIPSPGVGRLLLSSIEVVTKLPEVRPMRLVDPMLPNHRYP